MGVTCEDAAIAFLSSSFDAAASELGKKGLTEDQIIEVARTVNEVRLDFPNHMTFNEQLSGKGKKKSLYETLVNELSSSNNTDFLDKPSFDI